MATATRYERTRPTPRPCRRIIHLRAGQIVGIITPGSHEDFSIGQKRRRVATASRYELAGPTPCPRRGIIHLRAAERVRVLVKSTYDEHFPIGQERRRVMK